MIISDLPFCSPGSQPNHAGRSIVSSPSIQACSNATEEDIYGELEAAINKVWDI